MYTFIKDFGVLICTIIGVTLALYQYYNSERLKRSHYLRELMDKLRGDKEIRHFIQLIEHDGFIYDQKHFNNTQLEIEADKALEYLSYICYLRKAKEISKAEFVFFEYEINHMLIDTEVKKYLKAILDDAKKTKVKIKQIKQRKNPKKQKKDQTSSGIPHFPFKHLVEFAKEKGIII